MAVKNNARTLIMDLLFADPDVSISIRQFLLAGQLFEISENSIRVALTRLSNDELIETIARGIYCLTKQAKEISEPVANRAKGIRQTRPWNGDFLAVHTGALNRADRGALSRRERTLHLNGFRELQPDLFIRPDNLIESQDITRKRLIQAGVDERASFFVARDFDPIHQKRIPRLWDKKALHNRYQTMSQRIEIWLENADSLTLPVAARESLLIGREAIPLMMTDPLLPEPLIDTLLQQNFFEDVIRLDQRGHAYWKQLYDDIYKEESSNGKSTAMIATN